MAYGPSDLMGDLIALIEKRWASVHDVQAVADTLGLTQASQRIHFYREIKRLIRLTPVEVFVDEEQRENLLGVCQHALDSAIEQEEDELMLDEDSVSESE